MEWLWEAVERMNLVGNGDGGGGASWAPTEASPGTGRVCAGGLRAVLPRKKAGEAQAGSEGPSALRPMFAKLDQNVLWPQPQRTDGE